MSVTARHKRAVSTVLITVLSFLLFGCVERKLIIRTQPDKAVVFVDGERRGTTPYEEKFVYYGTREIICMKDGYKTLAKTEKIKKPFYQWFLLDLFVEILPFNIKEHTLLEYTLEETTEPDSEQVLKRAEELKKLLDAKKH